MQFLPLYILQVGILTGRRRAQISLKIAYFHFIQWAAIAGWFYYEKDIKKWIINNFAFKKIWDDLHRIINNILNSPDLDNKFKLGAFNPKKKLRKRQHCMKTSSVYTDDGSEFDKDNKDPYKISATVSLNIANISKLVFCKLTNFWNKSK